MTDSRHNPKAEPRRFPKNPVEREPDTVATPEGDNEYPPDEPLGPAPDGLQRIPAIDTNKL